MLSQELRIGNLVGFYKSKIHEIQYGKIYEIAIPENPQALEDIYHATIPEFGSTPIPVAALQPILLTKDWLINKLGFLEDIEFERDIRYIHESTMLYELKNTSTLESGFVIQCCASTRKAIYIISEPLVFVHDLQNLHFSLTRQELQIKEA